MASYDDWLSDVGPWPEASEEPLDACEACGWQGASLSSFARPGICWLCWAAQLAERRL